MVKTYSPKQFFREIPAGMLLEYLALKSCAFPEAPKVPDSEQLYDFWNSQSEEMRMGMEEDFLATHEFLLLPNAIESVYQEAEFRRSNLERFPVFVEQAQVFYDKLEALTTAEEKAFWVFMHHVEIFDNAFRFSSADKRAGKRFSTKRPTGHFSKPKDDDEAKKELGASISAYFQAKGKGGGHEVDILDRKGVIYYFIYLEDHPRSGGVFKKGRYKREILRTSFEVVFWFNPENGELSTCATGGHEVRQELERRFAEICLGNPDLPPLSKKPVYNLEKFKNISLLLNVDRAEGFLSVRVKSLKLLAPESNHHIVIDSKDKDGDARDILKQLSLTAKNGNNIPLTEFKTANVEIEISQTSSGRRPDKLAFNLFYPNGSNLGDTPRDRLIRSYLVQWGIEAGGTSEILRQLLLALGQGQFIGHLQTREWPEEILGGLLEQKILLEAPEASSLHCLHCEEQPLCDVKYRDEGGIATAYITCSQCGYTPLKPEEIRQFKVSEDEIASLIVKELGLSKGTISEQARFLDLGPYPKGEAGDRIFLLRESAESETILENEAGLCFGQGLDFERPAWLAKRLCFFSLRREIHLDGRTFHMDAARIQAVYERFLESLKPELRDEFNNPRPAKLTQPGNIAGRNKELRITWREYLGIYTPEVQVYLFEKETAALDWQQAQRARFIFPGEAAVSQYNRHFKNLERTALSGNSALEEDFFSNPYKRRWGKSNPE